MVEINKELLDLLEKVARKSDKLDSETTFITNYDGSQAWEVNENKLAEFWITFCDLVAQKKPNLSLSEPLRQFSPFVVELGEVDNDDLVKEQCLIYQQRIREKFILGFTNVNLLVIVLEAMTSSNKKLVKLIFPYAILSNEMAAEIYHKAAHHNQLSMVPLYGTITAEGHQFELKHIWSDITMTKEPEEMKLEDAFVLTNHAHIQRNLLDISLFNLQRDCQHWLPMLLSNQYWPQVLRRKS